jgi:hypothetical protein
MDKTHKGFADPLGLLVKDVLRTHDFCTELAVIAAQRYPNEGNTSLFRKYYQELQSSNDIRGRMADLHKF